KHMDQESRSKRTENDDISSLRSWITLKRPADESLRHSISPLRMATKDASLRPREAKLKFRLIHIGEARNPKSKILIGQEILLIDEEKQQVYSKLLRPSFITVQTMSESQTALKNQPQSSASSGLSYSWQRSSRVRIHYRLYSRNCLYLGECWSLCHQSGDFLFPHSLAGGNDLEKLNDRAKTLHPNIHGGILARRDVEHHMEAFNEHGVGTFDVVVINLYPFYDKVTAPGGISFEDGIENIDIGGAAMIKAVAKNHKDVLIVVDSEDYQAVLEYLKGAQNDQKFRRKSAWKAFQHIAAYDSAVSEWLWKQTEGRRSRCSGFQLCWIPAVSVLRYGVELAVADKSDEAVYVGSGGEITKLTNIRAAKAGHLHTFTISSIFNKRNCPPVPDFVVDGVSSLTINVCAGPPDNENEPAGETTAGGASVTNLLIPTSLKQLRRHALHRLKRIVVSHGVGS
ncbi:hypothetical protein HID58_015791, partial [Brassica napus]